MKRLLLIPTIALLAACGGEETPSKVGEVANTAAPVEEQATAPHTEEEQVAKPTATEGQTTEPTATQAPSPTETPAESPTDNYQAGDIISIGDVVMVVLGWSSPPGDDFSQPDEGKMFVAVDLLLVNQGDRTITVSSMLQMSLKDATGQKYNVDLMTSTASGSIPEGELSPGERVRGKVGFQVPQDASGLVFVFDADVFGTGKVFTKLGPEPVTVEPPSQLAGEREQEMFVAGDIIEIGELTLTVNEVTYPQGDDFNKPDEGKKFLVVDLTLQNTSAEAKMISSLLQMYLKDKTGQKYEVDLIASTASGGTMPDGEIAPDEKLRGQVGFQVPEDAESLVFVFDADVFGHGKILVRLTQS